MWKPQAVVPQYRRRAVLKWIVLIAAIVSCLIVSASWVPQWFPNTEGKEPEQSSLPDSFIRPNVSECILLYGAFCNGNLGDIIQASTMSRLMKSLASDSLCVWHAYPANEETTNCFEDGKFFDDNSAGSIPLSCDKESGEQVSRFKGFIIGGGGLLVSRHSPLYCQPFVEGLGNELPVAIFAVGASSDAKHNWPIVQRSNYVSGRDRTSVLALSSLLDTLEAPRAKPHEVATVRDPVLSDGYYTDVGGACWKQSKGPQTTTHNAPLCFILPSAKGSGLQMLHRVFSSEIVGQNDILLNVFPKHQSDIETYPYPVPVEAILDPERLSRRLCGCRAVVSSRLHGTILSLHAGIPTLAAWPIQTGKVPDLMKEVLQLPDQFVEVTDGLTREVLDRHVDRVGWAYARGRRDTLFEELESKSRRTIISASHVLKQFMYVPLTHGGGGKAPTLWETSLNSPYAMGVDNKGAQMASTPVTNVHSHRKPSAENSELDTVRQPSFTVDCLSWKWLGAAECKGGRLQVAEVAEVAEVGKTLSMSGSPALSFWTLVVIALLGLPGIASLSRSRATSTVHQRADISTEKKTKISKAGLAVRMTLQFVPLFDKQNPRMSGFVFFSLNYVAWVVLSMGFSICSKTYLNETRSPMVLLAIQSWIGIAILCAMNSAARSRCRSVNASTCRDIDETISSSTPFWLGKCGLEQALRERRNVWQAGLLHSGNAVLTSWSVLIGGVAATHVLKALEPVVAMFFSKWLLGSRIPPRRAASVAIIVLGVGIFMMPLTLLKWISENRGLHSVEGRSGSVTWEAGVNLAIPALVTTCACCTVALRNVLLKGGTTLSPPPPPPLGLLVCCVVGAGAGSLALVVPFLPFGWGGAGGSVLRMSGVNAALCFVGYNLASFNLLSELSPVGHAVGNASKRLCVIVTALYLLGEGKSITPTQLAGASLAFVGLVSYNLAGTHSLAAPATSR